MPECSYCHNSFEPTHHAGGSPQVYCSDRCRNKARNKRYRLLHPEHNRKWAMTWYYKHVKAKEAKHVKQD